MYFLYSVNLQTLKKLRGKHSLHNAVYLFFGDFVGKLGGSVPIATSCNRDFIHHRRNRKNSTRDEYIKLAQEMGPLSEDIKITDQYHPEIEFRRRRAIGELLED